MKASQVVEPLAEKGSKANWKWDRRVLPATLNACEDGVLNSFDAKEKQFSTVVYTKQSHNSIDHSLHLQSDVCVCNTSPLSDAGVKDLTIFEQTLSGFHMNFIQTLRPTSYELCANLGSTSCGVRAYFLQSSGRVNFMRNLGKVCEVQTSHDNIFSVVQTWSIAVYLSHVVSETYYYILLYFSHAS